MLCCSLSSNSEVIKRKIVVVGDGTCGKTCLLSVFTTGRFPAGYIPTIFENSIKDFTMGSQQIAAELWDTAGQEDFDRLRTLSYPDSDVILVTFSVDSPESLDNITVKWMPELRRYCPGLPVILVGCKTDLRQDPKTIEALAEQGQQPITLNKGISMGRQIGAYKYVECSAKQNTGVEEVFHAAIQSTLKKKSFCNIM